ncbi:hypothetical protein Q7P37_010184 [Cladosporium fusiforme]
MPLCSAARSTGGYLIVREQVLARLVAAMHRHDLSYSWSVAGRPTSSRVVYMIRLAGLHAVLGPAVVTIGVQINERLESRQASFQHAALASGVAAWLLAEDAERWTSSHTGAEPSAQGEIRAARTPSKLQSMGIVIKKTLDVVDLVISRSDAVVLKVGNGRKEKGEVESELGRRGASAVVKS